MTLANDIGAVSEDTRYQIRVSSVFNYSSILPQYQYPGVYNGLDYDLIVSMPGHETNRNALELEGKSGAAV